MGSVIDGVLRCLTEIWWAVMKGVGDGLLGGGGIPLNIANNTVYHLIRVQTNHNLRT